MANKVSGSNSNSTNTPTTTVNHNCKEGSNFDKRYTIGKLLGHGQFRYTYVATDKANRDRVAVKRIEKNKMVLPITVEDVEVKILQQLAGHENVIHFYNAFEDDSYVYIVMDSSCMVDAHRCSGMSFTWLGVPWHEARGKKFQDIVGSAYYVAP
ncbi:hypothetical protein FNV43_RR00702 [Rhamnella rubrinervis]|uniref:Protein kinase domain-containing protein n=1 Tax=Rhamnella rubrinervis TaxID=2594499 RepID=A0A8K0HR66_9ROSA|nr:hypothetical protein FNV43_RR00702 [Rhamnella rubrinervis]